MAVAMMPDHEWPSQYTLPLLVMMKLDKSFFIMISFRSISGCWRCLVGHEKICISLGSGYDCFGRFIEDFVL